MAKMLVIENCGSCRHSSSIAIVRVEPFEAKCYLVYTDERHLYHKKVDTRTIPDWCPLQDFPPDIQAITEQMKNMVKNFNQGVTQFKKGVCEFIDELRV